MKLTSWLIVFAFFAPKFFGFVINSSAKITDVLSCLNNRIEVCLPEFGVFGFYVLKGNPNDIIYMSHCNDMLKREKTQR
jgi:hypothetical protein